MIRAKSGAKPDGEGVVLPALVSSTPNLDCGGFYPNKDVTITESGPGPLIPVGRRISEDWFPRGPGHETLLPITSGFPSQRGDPGTDRPQGQVSAPVRNWPMHLANCAIVSVQRAEQLVSLAKGSSPIHTYHSFSTEQIHQTFTARFTHSWSMGDEKKAQRGRTEL